jgi:pyruvate-formate lyase-activating enzyme
MSQINNELKSYLDFIKMELKMKDDRMKEIEEQVKYLDNQVYEILQKYPNGKIDIIAFLVYIIYVLNDIIDDEDVLEAFIRLLRKVYDMKKTQS